MANESPDSELKAATGLLALNETQYIRTLDSDFPLVHINSHGLPIRIHRSRIIDCTSNKTPQITIKTLADGTECLAMTKQTCKLLP